MLQGVTKCEAYLDDLVIHSSTWSQHVEQLQVVFGCLATANLMVNLAKCKFGQATVTYLWKVDGRGEVCPIETKIEAIMNLAAPLTDLLSPKVPFVQTEICVRTSRHFCLMLLISAVLSN